MKVYYAVWRIILRLPVIFKNFLELFILLLLCALTVCVVVILFQYVIIKIIFLLNRICFGGMRWLLLLFGKKNKRIYVWDETLGDVGSRNERWIQKKEDSFKNYRFWMFFQNKWVWLLFLFCYILTILPCFRLERFISEYYLENIYAASDKLQGIEAVFTQGIENYPDFFKEEIRQESEEQQIYLDLKEDITLANVRAESHMDSEVIAVVSQEDEILYQGIYEEDDGRTWLKVTVISQGHAEGWISSKVILQEIMQQ